MTAFYRAQSRGRLLAHVLAFGMDNVNNYKHWNFHPYPQRSHVAEVKVDL
jgi:hypothetical protein